MTNVRKVNPIVAGITGMVVGGAAVASAILMSNKKNQKKVKDAWIGTKEKVIEVADSIKSQPVIKKLKAEDKV